MKKKFSIKETRKAHEDGKIGVIFDTGSPNELTRFRQEGVAATGKMIDGEYVVVFWDRVIDQIRRGK